MKFITDVNITQTVIAFLRQSGHEVLDLKKSNRTLSDIEIIKMALEEGRIVLTHDKDFLTLVKYPKYQVGTIIIRLLVQNSQHFCDKLKDLFREYTEDSLINSLTIIREESIEVKPYKQPNIS